jgi:hypothetical protein
MMDHEMGCRDTVEGGLAVRTVLLTSTHSYQRTSAKRPTAANRAGLVVETVVQHAKQSPAEHVAPSEPVLDVSGNRRLLGLCRA